jgi:hypothetical protein
MSGIKQDIIERIQNSTKAKTRLAYEFAKHQSTIDRWLEENNLMLTTQTALKAISEELEVAESEILIEA